MATFEKQARECVGTLPEPTREKVKTELELLFAQADIDGVHQLADFALERSNPQGLRAFATWLLGRLRDDTIDEDCLQKLARDVDPKIRVEACESAGLRSESSKTVPPFLIERAQRDPSEQVRQVALAAIAYFASENAEHVLRKVA